MSKRMGCVIIVLFSFVLFPAVRGTNSERKLASDFASLGYQGFPMSLNQLQQEKISTCGLKIEKVGCYRDHVKKPRPLPELIVTDRDPFSDKNDGHVFDWENPDKSMQSLVCRCAEKTLEKKYTYFALQFFAECWSGKNAAFSYDKDGLSQKCLGRAFSLCNNKADSPCTGTVYSNYVYKVFPPGVSTPVPPTVAAVKCEDKYSICEHYANNGLCNNKFPMVLEYCKKSCNLC